MPSLEMSGDDMPGSLRLHHEVLAEICRHAESELPLEACGYLAGKGNRISKAFRMRNADISEKHFSFEPEEQFAVAKEARNADLELIAVYHSHPDGPPDPSAEDLRLAIDPDLIYVIISLRPELSVKAFRVIDGRIQEVLLSIGKEEE